MATLTWDAVGGDPAPGDPAAFEAMARGFERTAEDAADAKRKLESFSKGVDDSIWRGESAGAFREKISELPGRLGKLHSSYTAASDGVAGYGRSLRDLQGQARSLLSQAQGAQDDQTTQEASRDRARDADPTAPTTAHDDAIAAAQGRLNGARNSLDDLRDRRRGAEDRAIGKLDEAGELGIANDSWWKRTFDAIDNWVDEHADILKTLSEALKVISAIAGVLSFIPFLAPICGPIALIAGGLALLTDAALAATGNGDWKMLLVDAALMALPGAGALLRAGLRGTRVATTGAKAMKGLKSVGGRAKGMPKRIFKRLTCGDPVDVATGEVVMSHTDVQLPGALPLVLSRTYVSSSRVSGGFGPSWFSTFDQMLEISSDGIVYASADGMVLAYTVPDEAAPAFPEKGPRWPLARTGHDRYTVFDADSRNTLHFAPTAVAGPGPAVAPLAAIVDRNGDRIDVDRDQAGTLTGLRHSGGYHLDVESADGLTTAVRLRGRPGDTDQLLVRYGYDDAGRLDRVVNSSGEPLRFEHDGHGRIVRWDDRIGCWYRYTYDDETGACVATSGPDGMLDATFVYDTANRATLFTDSLGNVRSFFLDERGRLTREVDPAGNVVTAEWDDHDRLLTRTDPLGRTTRYRYDGAGNLMVVTRPDGSQVETAYDDRGLPVRVVEPTGAVWQRAYDDAGNVTDVTDPMGATTRYAYDERGHPAAVTDALGHVRRVESNPAGLPVATVDPLGAVVRYQRDGFGRIIATTDPVGGVTRYQWTVEGLLAARTSPSGATERWTHDGEGNLVAYVDPAGGRTRYDVGHFDLPRAEIGPDGSRLEMAYDTELRLTSVSNALGLVWRYDYDSVGNLVGEVDFNGCELHYLHDGAGQLVQRTNGLGEALRFVRDRLGKVVEVASAEGSATFAYDPAGNLVAAANADAEVVLEYDRRGRVLSESLDGAAVTSSYDLLGRRTGRRTPSGAHSEWEYDANDAPLVLRTDAATLTFAHDAAGREVQRRAGNAMLTQAWDADHRLASQTLEAAAPTPGGLASAAGRLVQRRSFAYRADGHLVGIDDLLAGPRRFDLDAVGRITGVHGAGWTERYAYDTAGNVTHGDWPTPAPTATDEPDARGERVFSGTLVRRAGDVRYEHDAQGRVTLRQQRRRSGRPLTWRYQWDSYDRLVSVTTPDGDLWRYRYDPLGRRVAKERVADDGTVGERVGFVWDGIVLAEEVGAERTTVWDWEPDRFRPAAQTEWPSSRDAPQEVVDERFFAIVADVVGTPTELVDIGGALAWRSRTTLWGTPVADEPGAVSCPLRFPGQYHDAETGLNFNFFRYYSPVTAGYVSPDPLGLDGGPNPHEYVPNPLVWTDPMGEKCEHGSYTNTFASGKKYHGKGSRVRSQRSARKTAREFNDDHVATDWKPSPSEAESFKDEARRIRADGGPARGDLSKPNYNKIDSPGEKMLGSGP